MAVLACVLQSASTVDHLNRGTALILNEITLAWAVTIHKSQGSEYPVVVMLMYRQHYLMLSRNLLYIDLTRAKQLAISVGPKKAIGLAVRQMKAQERYTLLSQRLTVEVG